jgi:hypothetical protein
MFIVLYVSLVYLLQFLKEIDTHKKYERMCNETNLMHCVSSVYSVTIPLHVSGFLVAHRQEVTMYICDNWYLMYVLVDCQWAWMEWNPVHYYLLTMGYWEARNM